MSIREFDPLAPFHPAVREWFTAAFEAPTRPQALGWPAIARGDSTLILAPTGSGKTLTAFLWCLDRLMFAPAPPKARALPRALRLAAQGAGGRRRAQPARAARRHRAGRRARAAIAFVAPAIAIRTGDTPQAERARFQREPADILITTPESLYLLLTSNAREALALDRHDHHRRDPRAGADQARRAPRAVARAARGAAASGRRSASACPRRSGRSTRSRGFSAASNRTAGRASAAANAAPAVGARPQTTRGNRPRRRSRDEFAAPRGAVRYRPVTIVDAGAKKALKLTIEVPVEDMAQADDRRRHPERPGVGRRSRGRRSGRRSIRGCSS